MARTLSTTEARRAMVTAQLLAGPRPTSVVEAVERLARLQIDPTNVIARAEHLVLWSRMGHYPVADLHHAAYADRSLFEYWAYYLPARDFPVHRETMRRWPVGDNYQTRRVREFLAANARFRRYVLAELRRRGPLRSRDLEDRADVPWRSGGWNDGRNVGRMLDSLLMTGDIAVTDRQGRERVWDLASRCHPLDQPRLSPREAARRLIDVQLRARGIARAASFGWQFGHVRPPKFDEALEDLVRAGTAVPVEVTGHSGPWYAHVEPLDADFVGRTTLLCPFDRLIYDRELTEELFDFRYRMEMYVPRDQREFGYYVLPILDGDALIGRVDARMDRKARKLVVDGIFAEKGAPTDAGSRIATSLADLATWQGATAVLVSQRVPRMWIKTMP
jgi:uncharacterized protein